MLGHTSIAFNLTVYGHLFDDRLDDLAARLDDLKMHPKSPAGVEIVSFGGSKPKAANER